MRALTAGDAARALADAIREEGRVPSSYGFVPRRRLAGRRELGRRLTTEEALCLYPDLTGASAAGG